MIQDFWVVPTHAIPANFRRRRVECLNCDSDDHRLGWLRYHCWCWICDVYVHSDELYECYDGNRWDGLRCYKHRDTISKKRGRPKKCQSQKTDRSLRFKILSRDKFTCRYCGRKAPEVTLEVDHVTPKSKGGTKHPSNLVAACFDCNRGKRDKEVSR